jgi:hypothetical protein
MLKVCFCAKQVDGLTASRQILTSKKDSIKPPISLDSVVCLRTSVIYAEFCSCICYKNVSSRYAHS